MTEYKKLFQCLELPALSVKILDGTIKHPSYGVRNPFECYGFPPALLPLWSDGSSPSYVGYWKHWFCKRDLTLVSFYVEEGKAYEIARNFEQLIWFELLRLLDNESLEEELKQFVAELQIGDLNLLNLISQKSGNDPKGLIEISCFTENPPLEVTSAAENYKGDFPISNNVLTESYLRNICTSEISSELSENIKQLPFAPEWFLDADQERVFHKLIEKNDFLGSWMSLNSSGWTFKSAKEAILKLGKKVQDKCFDDLIAVWTDQNHEIAGGY